MSETTNRQAVIMGLFVSIGVAIFAGGIVTIGGIDEAFRRNVRVTAVFDDVGGLQDGDAVWFSGVPVGTVREVRLAGGGKVEVELSISEDASAFVRSDAVASVGSDGLIGNPIVVVSEGSADAPPVADGAVLEADEAASVEDMMAMLQENNANLLAITERLASGEGTVGRLLADDRLYTDVKAAVDTLRDASVNAEVLTANLASFAGKMNQPGTLPNQLVTDRETYASLTSTVERFEQVADDAGRIVDGLERGATDPATPIGTLLHDRQAGGDLKQTLDQLNTSSQLLTEDLEALQHNFLLRGYFKKRAREQERQQEQEELRQELQEREDEALDRARPQG